MIAFRQADPRFPFLWSDPSQPAGRWHAEGEGPARYVADTPDGAWAELIRHEEITEPADLATVRRALWAIEIGDDDPEPVTLSRAILTGGLDSYAACQAHARRLLAPSAAPLPGGATGRTVVAGQEQAAARREGRVIVIFGDPAGLVGWKAVDRGAPPADLLPRVRTLISARRPRASRGPQAL